MTTRITSENITDATIGTADLASSVPLNTQWQSVKTSDFTAVAGEGYFVDTTSAAVEVTLPASPSAGDTVVLKDYARTWNTNNVTTASALFDGGTNSSTFSTNGQTVTLVYMDGTRGWSLINEDTSSNLGPTYTTATGGTVVTSGDYKIHTFTGDGCFVVSCAGTAPDTGIVDYLVVAGGGGAGNSNGGGGGGGAGGFRLSNSTCMPAPLTSPLANPTGVPVTATTYPITVGGGGSASSSGSPGGRGTNGSNSVFSTITSAGGGGGGGSCANGTGPALPGGSGGGGGGQVPVPSTASGGGGNQPPVSPPQGNPGGDSSGTGNIGSGGGGAGAAGTSADGEPGATGLVGDGGAGSYVQAGGIAPPGEGTPGPIGGARYFAGGGGGQNESQPTCRQGQGGVGGGGAAATTGSAGNAGGANTGGGGGGADASPGQPGGAGGKGIVILRYKFQ